jgi:hypothetical protein
MTTRQQHRALARTLEQANVRGIRADQVTCLAYADAVAAQNRKVHHRTNEILLDLLLSGEFGTCIHVTGEMRALLDPFHRQVCSEMYRKKGAYFFVLYDLPEAHRKDRDSVIKWNLSRWSAKGTHKWDEQLRTLDIIGDRTVDIRAHNTLNEIQYSVFGNKYILLQEKHPDTARAKRLWLLESEALNQVLTEHAQELLQGASDIDESWYRSFLISLSGVTSRVVLKELAEGKNIGSEELFDKKLPLQLDEEPLSSVSALKTAGFLKDQDHGTLAITARGREYLTMLERS